jgi:2-aminoethylphosphonate-pyruvate transaminase
MTRIQTAVILAAGLGSRLGELKEDKPKAFLRIGDETLIYRSIKLLISKDINKVIIGTGYGSDHFNRLIKTFPQIITHRNEKFESTGSMYTLYLLRDLITGPFLLLEGDLLYSVDALNNLMDDEQENIILASTATNSGDEVFIQCNEHQELVNMSKAKDELDLVCGELVGISKLSINSLDRMIKFSEEHYRNDELNIHYEDALVGIAGNTSLPVKVVPDLAWCEIDDASHLDRAISVVYPKILAQERL